MEDIISTSIKDTEILYLKNKKQFDKANQGRIETNIESLKSHNIKGHKSKIYRELIDELNLRIYNKRGIVLKTWEKVFGLEILKQSKILIPNEKSEINLKDIFILPDDDSDNDE